MATAIPATDADNSFDATEDGVNDFYKRLTGDATEPSETESGEDEEDTEEEEPTSDTDEDTSETEESPEDADSEDEDADEEDTDAEKPSRRVVEDEDAVVKLKVDGEVVEASIKDLKRLYGQEASLTRKSQEAAETKRKAEETGVRYLAGLDSMLQRAREQAAPYANINFLALTKDPNVSHEELTALSDAANRAFDNVRYLEQELDTVVRTTYAERQQQIATQARETVKVLSDPKTGIAGWNEDMYNNIRSFAVSAGMDQQVVNELVDPVAFRILHMAMQYQKGKSAVVKTKKVDKTPKRIIKGTPEETIKKAKPSVKRETMDRLYKTGHVDDATQAFLDRLGG